MTACLHLDYTDADARTPYMIIFRWASDYYADTLDNLLLLTFRHFRARRQVRFAFHDFFTGRGDDDKPAYSYPYR